MAAPSEVPLLREAVAASPDNAAIRILLAEALLRSGAAAEAEGEFREALKRDPVSDRAKLGLAEAFLAGRKTSQAFVLVEDLAKRDRPPPRALLLQARILLDAEEGERAARAYRRAVEADESLRDPALEARLGGRAPEPGEDEGEGGDEEDEGERLRLRADGEPGAPVPEIERPRINFDHVGGMEALKEEVRMKIIHPLTKPELFKAYGKPAGGGLLLYGPPGCGKTHLSRATAGEARVSFLAIGIHEILDSYLGQSERNMHEIFETARRSRPCILFFDEVDALGASRSDMRHSWARTVINQFLAEMDGAKGENEGLLVLGATNAPWHMDAAFRRPGRFDRVIFVPPPDPPARAEVLRIHLRGKPMEEGIDYDGIAKATEGFSGADLKGVCDRAVEAKIAAAMKEGIPRPLGTRDLQKAAKSITPSTKEWFATARNYALYANQGGGYDDILKYLNIRR